MKPRTSPVPLLLLLAYVALSLSYQVIGAVSLVIGYFDLRHQVTEPFEIEWYQPEVTTVSEAASHAGLRRGDVIESINGASLTGRAQVQAARWYAHAGETMRLGVRRQDGTRTIAAISLTGYPPRFNPGEAVFVVVLQIVVPLFCLFLGYWVSLARPNDLIAWLILILLSYPQSFITVSVYNWLPGWLGLRLFWHIGVQIIAPAALLWLGLLFPERSGIDVRWPWLKWLFLAVQITGLAGQFISDYVIWFHWSLFPVARAIDSFSTQVLLSTTVLSIVVYSGAILEKLRTASIADARRRLRVLSLGSLAGLGSNLIIWAVLPRFGYNPTRIQWLGYLSSLLLLIFPLTLAYVVVVQRALEVRLLLRMGTKYILARSTLIVLQISFLSFIFFRVVIPALERKQIGSNLILPVFFVAMMVRIYFVKRGLWERLRERIDKRFFREAYDAEAVLSDLADHIRSILEPEALLNAVSTRIAEVLHTQRIGMFLRHGDGFRVQRITGSLVLEAQSSPVRHLVRTNVPALLYRDRPESWYLESTVTERGALDELNAEVLLPLTGRNRLMGVMVLGPKLSEEPYSQTDLRLLAAVGGQVGLGLEINDLAQSLAHEAAKGERMAREVEIAREVQQRLFPQTTPSIPGLDLAGRCRPALAVGGDYYDMIELDDGRLALAIGDVSGKGIGAALLMASLRASLRGMTDSASHDLARMIRKLNRLVYESSTSNRYATFFFGIYDPAARELRYVNAGHNAPMLLREGEVVRLEATGPVVGLLKDVEFEEQVLAIRPGDLFVGYTDGISEAMTLEDEEWGDERMLETAQAVQKRSSKEIIGRLFEGADEFAAGAPQYDDMTLLVFKSL